MHFRGEHGASLELEIVGYQFPVIENEPYDSNWLVISGRGTSDAKSWTFSDPCLLTREVAALADWLEARSRSGKGAGKIGFIEPNLYFRWKKGVLRVDFEIECRPPWAKDVSEFYLLFSPSPEELASAAASLREQLRKHPARGRRGRLH